jgi:hypothetical protein
MKAGEGTFSDRESLWGGQSKDVIEAAQAKGVVSRECMDKAVKKVASDMTEAQFAQFAEVVHDKYKWKFFEEEEYYELVGAIIDARAKKETAEEAESNHASMAAIKSCRYDKALHELRELKLLGRSVTKILKNLVNDCRSREVYTFTYNEEIRKTDEDDEMGKVVDKVLTRNKPATISLCSKALRPNVTANLRKSKDIKNDCGPHALLVTGKRENGGKCEYLLRNSWGAQWQPLGASCACRTTDGRYWPDCNKQFSAMIEKAGGNVSDEVTRLFKTRTVVGCWFPADVISRNAYRAGGVE